MQLFSCHADGNIQQLQPWLLPFQIIMQYNDLEVDGKQSLFLPPYFVTFLSTRTQDVIDALLEGPDKQPASYMGHDQGEA